MYSCVCIHSVLAGVIVTARRFDRERQREYSVTVTATDWAEEPLIGICQLTVQILDQNDNSPKFENLRYECKSLARMIYVGSIGERLLNIIISAKWDCLVILYTDLANTVSLIMCIKCVQCKYASRIGFDLGKKMKQHPFSCSVKLETDLGASQNHFPHDNQ